jgi:hypothetical protein
MSDFGLTTWAQQPYSHDFAVGSNRPRKVRDAVECCWHDGGRSFGLCLRASLPPLPNTHGWWHKPAAAAAAAHVEPSHSRQVISVDAMDAAADWPTRVEELRFDPLDPSDPTWMRCVRAGVWLVCCCLAACVLRWVAGGVQDSC